MKQVTFTPRKQCSMCRADIRFSRRFGIRRTGGLNKKSDGSVDLVVLKCDNCGLIFPRDHISIGSQRFDLPHEGALPRYQDVPSPGSFAHELKMIGGLMGRPLNQLDALDLGFGFGNSLLAMKMEFGKIYGVEPFKTKFDHTLQHPELAGVKENLQQSDADRCEFAEGSFDFIFFEAFQHLDDPGERLKSASKWLRKGGIVYMEVPSARWLMAKLFNLYYFILGKKQVANLSPLHGNFSNFEFTLDSFEKNSALSGLKVIHHEYYPCHTVFGGMLNRLLISVMKATNTGMQLAVYLKKE